MVNVLFFRIVLGAHRAETAAREDRRLKDDLRMFQYFQDTLRGLRGGMQVGVPVTAADEVALRQLEDGFARRQSLVVRSLAESAVVSDTDASLRRWIQVELGKSEAVSERDVQVRALARLFE